MNWSLKQVFPSTIICLDNEFTITTISDLIFIASVRTYAYNVVEVMITLVRVSESLDDEFNLYNRF